MPVFTASGPTPVKIVSNCARSTFSSSGKTESEVGESFKRLFTDYRYFADPDAARAYAAACKRPDITGTDDTALVLIASEDPVLHAAKLRLWCGEEPPANKRLHALYEPIEPVKKIGTDVGALKKIAAEVSAAS